MRGLAKQSLLVLALAAGIAGADDLSQWRKQLESDAARERYAAARALGALGEGARPALPALVEAMADLEPWVRLEAARAVVRIGARKEQIRGLLQRLESEDNDVTQLAAEALGGIGSDAVPKLLELAASDDARRILSAIAALRIAGRDAVPAVPRMLDLLVHENAGVQREAALALRLLGAWAEPVVADVIDRLRFGKPQVRFAAADILGRVGPAAAEAIPFLRELGKERAKRLKAAAAEALRRIDVARETAPEHPGLRDPSRASGKAPAKFRVKFETTKGEFLVEVERAWAPRGADRFYNLVRVGYFRDAAFFRVLPGFVAQFGLHAESKVTAAWDTPLADDKVEISNRRGTLTYAQAGKGTRTTQLFFNLRDNSHLDDQRFAPLGRVIEGIDVLDSLHSDYGDGPPRGKGPDQRGLKSWGNPYLKREFPRLDYIRSATIVQ